METKTVEDICKEVLNSNLKDETKIELIGLLKAPAPQTQPIVWPIRELQPSRGWWEDQPQWYKDVTCGLAKDPVSRTADVDVKEVQV